MSTPAPLLALAAVPVGIWLYLLIGRGGFWCVAKNLAPRNFRPAPGVRVVAVIPARNEAAVIGKALESLRGQTFAIVVADDLSGDATGEIATAAGAAGLGGTGLGVMAAPASGAGETFVPLSVTDGVIGVLVVG